MNFFVMLPLVALSIGQQQVKTGNLDQLMTVYFEIKNALVQSDPELASEKAKSLNLLITDFKTGTLQNATKTTFEQNKGSLLSQLKAIGESRDVEKQRTSFAGLSENLWAIIKNSEDVSLTVFYDYCPMKKAWWLSEVAAIKNPYYGNKMLTCGKVQEKIN